MEKTKTVKEIKELLSDVYYINEQVKEQADNIIEMKDRFLKELHKLERDKDELAQGKKKNIIVDKNIYDIENVNSEKIVTVEELNQKLKAGYTIYGMNPYRDKNKAAALLILLDELEKKAVVLDKYNNDKVKIAEAEYKQAKANLKNARVEKSENIRLFKTTAGHIIRAINHDKVGKYGYSRYGVYRSAHTLYLNTDYFNCTEIVKGLKNGIKHELKDMEKEKQDKPYEEKTVTADPFQNTGYYGDSVIASIGSKFFNFNKK